MTAVDSAAERAYLEAAMPARSAPWREVTFSVIDFETTGLDPTRDEIISFATVTVAGGRVRLDDARYELVRPKRMPEADTIRIHGLRETDLADAPRLDELFDGLLETLTGRALVAHVAAIETGFLRAAFEPHGVSLRAPLVDTAALAVELRRLQRRTSSTNDYEVRSRPAISSPGLGSLARSLGLPVHRPHHADGDALTTAQAFIALGTHLEGFRDPLTLRDLEAMGHGPHVGLLRSLLQRFGLGSPHT